MGHGMGSRPLENSAVCCSGLFRDPLRKSYVLSGLNDCNIVGAQKPKKVKEYATGQPRIATVPEVERSVKALLAKTRH